MCYDPVDNSNDSQDIANFNATVNSLASAGTGPLEVESDAGRVKQRPATELIATANYFAGLAAAQTRRKGVRMSRIIPDATVQGPRRGFRGPWTGYPDWNGFGWP